MSEWLYISLYLLCNAILLLLPALLRVMRLHKTYGVFMAGMTALFLLLSLGFPGGGQAGFVLALPMLAFFVGAACTEAMVGFFIAIDLLSRWIKRRRDP